MYKKERERNLASMAHFVLSSTFPQWIFKLEELDRLQLSVGFVVRFNEELIKKFAFGVDF